MRKYQPIWEKIKSNGTASLIASASSHKRIIQAVRKEKSKDLGWKFLLAEQNTRFHLRHTIKGKAITFTLERDKHYECRTGL